MAMVKIHPEPQNAILFAGSSIFHFWTSLAADMAPLPVVNQAFPGARMESVLRAAEKLIFPYQPKIIVYYCGSNDINDGAGVPDLARGFEVFVEAVRKKLPAARIFFVSVNKAPQKKDKWDLIDAANDRIREWCDKTEALGFIDINPPFSDEDRPRTDLFLEDGLHFRPEAYAAVARIIRPVLTAAWTQAARGE